MNVTLSMMGLWMGLSGPVSEPPAPAEGRYVARRTTADAEHGTACRARRAAPSSSGRTSGRTSGKARRATRRATEPPENRWITRWAPEPRMGEWALVSGLYQAGRFARILQPDLDASGQPLSQTQGSIGELGLRLGRYPSRFFGVELEAGTLLPRPSAIRNPTHFGGRGSVVVQVGQWTLTPFVLAGAGVFGVRRDRNIHEQSLDAMLHFGGGLKLYLSRAAQVRLDVRDVVAYRHRQGGAYRNIGLMGALSLAFTPGRARP